MMHGYSGRIHTTHPGVTCDSCRMPIQGSRFHCLDCVGTSFDYCENCERQPHIRNAHYGDTHLFAKIHDSTRVDVNAYGRRNVTVVNPMPPIMPPVMPPVVFGSYAVCDACRATINFGTRWKCAMCPDYDLCNNCGADFRIKNAHGNGMHSFISLPSVPS